MTLYLSSTVNLEDGTYTKEMQAVDGIKLLKDGYCMVMLNGRLRRRYFQMLQNNEMQWPSVPLRLCYAFYVDGKVISRAQAMILRTIAKIRTVNMRSDAAFTYMMPSLLSYARALEENYGVCFVAVHIMDIMEDVMSFNLLITNARATNIHYIIDDKMTMNN